MLMAAASAVKAAPCFSCVLKGSVALFAVQEPTARIALT